MRCRICKKARLRKQIVIGLVTIMEEAFSESNGDSKGCWIPHNC